MLQNEFTERTGIKLTEEEYQKVDAMYMEAGGDMNKDSFCKDWKKHRDSELLQIFYQQAIRLKSELHKKQLEQTLLATFIMDQAEVTSSPELRDKAIELLGLEGYLNRKIAMGYSLWEVDKQALIDILNEVDLRKLEKRGF